jgi:hypothetical protein
MGVDAVAFQSAGQRTEHYIPGTYSRTNYVKNSGGGVSANNAIIIGESRGESLISFMFSIPPPRQRMCCGAVPCLKLFSMPFLRGMI